MFTPIDSLRRYRTELINSIWLLSEKVVRFFLSFAVTLLIARFLLPAQFGIFSSFFALIGMLAPVTQMGLSGILIQKLVKAESSSQDQEIILQNAGALRLVGGLLLIVFVFVPAVTWIDRLQAYSGELALMFIANAFSCFGVYEAYFKAARKDKVNAMIQAGVLLFSGVVKVLCVFTVADKETLLSVLLVVTAMELALTPLVTFFVWRKACSWHWQNRLSKPALIDLWRDCRWLLLSGAAAVFYIKTDVVMVIWLMDDYAAGIYGAASRFTEVWFFLAPLLMNVFLPQLQKYFHDDHGAFVRVIRWLSVLMFVLSTTIAIATVLCGETLIRFALGEAFSQSELVLTWHVWLLPLVFLRAVISTWLIVNEYYRFSLVSHSLGAVTNIILNLLLIPSFGLLGAVIASWSAFFIATFIAMAMNASTRTFFTELFMLSSQPVRTTTAERNG